MYKEKIFIFLNEIEGNLHIYFKHYKKSLMNKNILKKSLDGLFFPQMQMFWSLMDLYMFIILMSEHSSIRVAFF